MTSLENFVGKIGDNLDTLDWKGKRDMIRCVVKRVEMGNDEINIVYRINKLPEHNRNSLQHCGNRAGGRVGDQRVACSMNKHFSNNPPPNYA